MVIHGEVNYTTTELEQKLFGVTVILVLLNSVLYGLLGELVFQFKCGNG